MKFYKIYLISFILIMTSCSYFWKYDNLDNCPIDIYCHNLYRFELLIDSNKSNNTFITEFANNFKTLKLNIGEKSFDLVLIKKNNINYFAEVDTTVFNYLQSKKIKIKNSDHQLILQIIDSSKAIKEYKYDRKFD